MKVLITAPTGEVGRRVLSELLAPEFSVRVLARSPVLLPEEIRGQVEFIRGSIEDVATLRLALEGVEALFWCVPRELLPATEVQRHCERFARAGAQAVRAAGTPRVVSLAVPGQGLTGWAGPLSGLHVLEEILNESGAAIRHLRCGGLMETLFEQWPAVSDGGVLSIPMPGDVAIPMVAAADVADVALRWLVRRDWQGVASLAVPGPEVLTLVQAAGILGCVLERPVRFEEASANQFVQSLVARGASPEYARSQVAMFTQLAHGISLAEARPVDSSSNTPTTLAAWAERERHRRRTACSSKGENPQEGSETQEHSLLSR